VAVAILGAGGAQAEPVLAAVDFVSIQPISGEMPGDAILPDRLEHA
jgi:hypothetical protein